MSVFLSGQLSQHGIKVVVTSYYDLDITFLGGKGYCQTFAALTGKDPRKSLEELNSHRLIELLADILKQGESCVVVHGVCCALNVPTYHLMMVIRDVATEKNVSKAFTTRVQLSPKFVKRNAGVLYKEFYLLKRSLERNAWYRHAYEIFCLCRLLTSDFTKRVEGTHGQPLDRVLYRRVERLVQEAFGPNYAASLGVNIVFAAYTAYALLVAGAEEAEEFDYTRVSGGSSETSSWIPSTKLPEGPRAALDPFLSGKHQPAGSAPALYLETPPNTPVKCAMLNLPSSEATLHVNVQVSHVKVLSKERMLHGVSGKSLVCTVVKKKTVACSSYKTVEPDWCVPTSNSLNFNIHGYDLSVMNALVALRKMRAICSADELAPIAVSHIRSSTHSFQNGVLNTNVYRRTILKKNIDTCFTVPDFPAVTMLNLGLLHRETVLMNVKGSNATEKSALAISKIIREAAEIDERLYTLLYELETETKELVDNHILGMFKVAYLFGKEDAARSIPRSILFDRLLVGFNPKTCKSEFSDKSKYDSESKGKASKKIKLVDRYRGRKAFLKRASILFPDVFVDPSNANSRGKWSFTDKINHSPDWVFYSDFMGRLLAELRSKYRPADRFSSLHRMIDMMVYERARPLS